MSWDTGDERTYDSAANEKLAQIRDSIPVAGMTLRQWYAGLAMQGFIAGCYAGNNAGFTVEGNVFAAVEYADALLAALEAGG